MTLSSRSRGGASDGHEPAPAGVAGFGGIPDLAWALHRLAVAIQEYDVVIARRVGLSAPEYLALKHLLVSAEPAGPAALARWLGVSSGSASELADRLVQAGHLRRDPHPVDRRRRVLVVTPATHRAIVAALGPLTAGIGEAARDLDPVHQAAVAAFLDRVSDEHDTAIHADRDATSRRRQQ